MNDFEVVPNVFFTVLTNQASFARCARLSVTTTRTMDIHPLRFRSTNRPWTQTTRRRFLSATTCCQDNSFSTALDACTPLSSVRMLNTVTCLRFVCFECFLFMFCFECTGQSSNKGPNTSTSCHLCRRSKAVAIVFITCSFCESRTCAACVTRCSQCDAHVCNVCSRTE